MSLEIDDSRWPLLVCTFGEYITDEELAGLLMESACLMARKEKYALIHDIRRFINVTPEQDEAGAAFIQDHAEEMRLYRVGVALIVRPGPSAELSTRLKQTHAPPFPTFVCHDMAAAVEWCRAQLLKHGVRIPP